MRCIMRITFLLQKKKASFDAKIKEKLNSEVRLRYKSMICWTQNDEGRRKMRSVVAMNFLLNRQALTD